MGALQTRKITRRMMTTNNTGRMTPSVISGREHKIINRWKYKSETHAKLTESSVDPTCLLLTPAKDSYSSTHIQGSAQTDGEIK